MAITRKISRVVLVPHEEGESFTFRLLSWKQIEQCKNARSQEQFQRLRDMGLDLLQAVQGIKTADVQAAAGGDGVAAVTADPFDTYDKTALLHMSITAWTYDEPVSDEAIDALDPVTAEWAARQILDLSGLAEADPTTASSTSTHS